MKICRECGIDKPLKDYYKHNKMSDGYLNKCKLCVKKRISKHRELNIEYIKRYDRTRGQTEKRKQKNKDYKLYMQLHEPERWKTMRYKACKKSRAKNHEKYIANSKVRYAVNTGKLLKEPCFICGALKSEAHHPDYTEPLKVIWLCDFHHKEEHKRLRELNRAPF